MLFHITLLTSAAATLGATCDPVSTFDSDLEGWTGNMIIGAGSDHPPALLLAWPPGWEVNGGNPGGFMSFAESGDQAEVYVAPPSFLGDLSGTYGGGLTFDVSSNVATTNSAAWLVGSQDTLVSSDKAIGTAWTSVHLSLSEVGWTRRTDGTTLSRTEMIEFLATVEALYIRADWVSGENTGGLDNPGLCTPVEGDFDGDGCVSLTDLLALLSAWGPCDCLQDLDDDNEVGTNDLLLLLGLWSNGC